MKTGVIIQARMRSSRLPGKVMMEIQGKSILWHVIERVKQARLVDEIIVATTIHPEDDVIAEAAKIYGVEVFRGSEADVLSRYYYGAKINHLDIVVRITCDCPLIDPHLMDELLEAYLKTGSQVATNAGIDLAQRTYPRGLDVEVFSFSQLERAFYSAIEPYQREHVTPYLYEHCESILFFKQERNDSRHRWTVDTQEDYELISAIYQRLFCGQHDFYMEEILALFDMDERLFSINAHVEQKKLKEVSS